MADEFRPLETRARAAVVAVAFVLLMDVVRIWSDWRELTLVDRILDNEVDLTVLQDLDANDDRQLAVAIIHLVAYIACAGFFIAWFHTAYTNITAIGIASRRFGTGWAIGAWFVPILNLWRPKQIANDIWRAGSLDLPRANVNSLATEPVAALVTAWWATWIVAGFLDNIVGRAFEDETLEARASSQFDIAAAVVEIVAGFLAIAVIRRMTARQNARRDLVAVALPPPATITSM